MELKLNSWHSRLYQHFYGVDPPENLCPYFWKIILALVLVVPVEIFCIPRTILKLVRKDASLITDFPKILTSFILYTLLAVVIILSFPILYYIFNVGGLADQAEAGIILWGLVIIVTGCLWLFTRERNESSSPNIFTEYIKASYHKYCPKITWRR